MVTKLREKQKLFIKEYLVDLNATKAAIRAGYSENTAKEMGYENLTKPHIQEEISKAIKDREEKIDINSQWVLKRLVDLNERCMQGVPVYDKDGNETGEWRFEPNASNKSLELIGKHLGMFVDKSENKNVNVNDDITDLTAEQRAERIKELLNK